MDDAISAGSAARGTYADLIACGARPVAWGALYVLGGAAKQFTTEHGLTLVGLASMDFALWRPEDCPLCRIGKPVTPMSDAP